MNNSNQSKKRNHVDLNFNTEDNSNRITMIYKSLYQLNDVVLGLVFLVGSLLFFSNTTMITGTVLFVIGSIQMTARPLIAFAHDLHLAHYYKKMDQRHK